MTDYERIAVLVNDAFITLYEPCMLVSKNTEKNALSRPDIIELNKQTKRMCLSLDCRHIVLEETEVNPAKSNKKKTTKHTYKLPIVGKNGVNDVSYVLKFKFKHRHKHSSHTKSNVSKHTTTDCLDHKLMIFFLKYFLIYVIEFEYIFHAFFSLLRFKKY
ncbi:hypothetical protein RFI_33063 [Reticulomyxa filosa]|uniref:Uncharacterized protein n=1 Tax=Reticulomyxa filosa TaxID=46433 RepID=X6LR37_RETFI|nr:hypothetical protein RFI_33063 [Reticulomyxa filosa]|eukprot:ETO04333.1 hypothetical protein RFI_33063 [Reticulomyxa filosa]